MYQLDANNFTMIFSHKWPTTHQLRRTTASTPMA